MRGNHRVSRDEVILGRQAATLARHASVTKQSAAILREMEVISRGVYRIEPEMIAVWRQRVELAMDRDFRLEESHR